MGVFLSLIMIVVVLIITAKFYEKKNKESLEEKKRLYFANKADEFNVLINSLPKPSITNEPYYLFVDVETTGLPKSRKQYIEKLTNWPNIVSIAWILTDKDALLINSDAYILKQKKEVPYEAYQIHGISKEDSIKNGVDPKTAMMKFAEDFNKTMVVVSHNIDFDFPIVVAEMLRNKIECNYKMIGTLCTMKNSVDFCKILKDRGVGYKYPTLYELSKFLYLPKYYGFFHITNSHNSGSDVKILYANFIKMKELQLIEDGYYVDYQT